MSKKLCNPVKLKTLATEHFIMGKCQNRWAISMNCSAEVEKLMSLKHKQKSCLHMNYAHLQF